MEIDTELIDINEKNIQLKELNKIVNDLDKSTPFNSDTSIKDEVITDVTLKVPLSLKYLSG